MHTVYPDDVLALVDTELDAAGVMPFLAAASTWVDNYMVGTCAALSVDKLPIITKYIAAHLIAIGSAGSGGVLLSARRQDIAESYAAPNQGEGSRYIAVAAAYDPCGIVEEFWIRGRPKFRARVGRGYA